MGVGRKGNLLLRLLGSSGSGFGLGNGAGLGWIALYWTTYEQRNATQRRATLGRRFAGIEERGLDSGADLVRCCVFSRLTWEKCQMDDSFGI